MVVEQDYIRIDKYLASKLDLSREVITDMITSGYILLNGSKCKPSSKVKCGDNIEVLEGFKKESTLVATPMDLDIVYEDDYLMVINKPSGLTVHPGAGNTTNTLVNGLLAYTNELSTDSIRPGIVHRLDKDTSGLMLVAKTDEVARKLSEDFKNHSVKRTYIALLDGVFPQKNAIIDAPIGRCKDNFEKMCVCANGKKAITHVSVIKKYKNYTLVHLNLETGRTHQIRVHLSSIGYPVHNDPLYGNKEATSYGQFLHSEEITFIHPITKKKLNFKVDVDNTFKEFLEGLE